MKVKICKYCCDAKLLICFSPNTENKFGVSNKCKKCSSTYSKEYRIKNKDKIFKIKEREKEIRKINKKIKDSIKTKNKPCSICGLIKNFNDFHKSKRIKDGHDSHCKTCSSLAGKKYRKENKEKIKKYMTDNKNKISNQRKHRMKIDLNFKLKCRLRIRLCNAIKNNYKSGSAVSDLGCTINEFKRYIEDKFEKGMTWENWGPTTWHLDHKLPLSKFDLTKREELLKAVHYSNIQPMWAIDNLTKSNSIV